MKTDLEQARIFIELITGSPDAAVTFQTFDDAKERGNGRLAQILHGSLGQHAARLGLLNQSGAGIFIMVNEGDGHGRAEKNVTGIRAVFVDCDKPDSDPLQLIADSGFAPDIIIESSLGKYHAYRRVTGCPVDKQLFAGVQLLLADRVQGDEAVKDLARVLRVPGFQHRKGEPFTTRVHEVRYPGRVTEFSQLLAELGITADQARQRAGMKTPRGMAASSVATRVGPVDPEEEFSVSLADGEGRNNHCIRLAGWCAQQGMSLERAIAHVTAWNQANIEPMLDKTVVDIVTRIVAKEAEKRAGFPLTELGFTERVAYLLAPRHKYVSDVERWMHWDGRTWNWDCGEIQEGVKLVARGLLDEAAKTDDDHRRQALFKHNKTCETRKTLSSAIALARTSPAIMISSSSLDRDRYALASDNAVINLRTGTASAPDPLLLLTHRAHVEYVPGADCPRWKQFLAEVFEDNWEIIEYVQRVLGYCLTGSTAEEICLVFVGSGANGKSTLLNIVMRLLGDYAQRMPSSALMVKRGSSGSNGPSPELARLRGARLAVTSEVATGRQLDEELLKNLVSKDSIAARFLHKDYFEFLPSQKLVFALNHLPTIASGDHGTWRRIRVIPFNRTFDANDKDVHLESKLADELPGILNWLLEGCLAWQRDGLSEPVAVKTRTSEYRTDLDIVAQFFDEACDLAANDPSYAGTYKTAAALLYQSYRRYCSTYGLPSVSNRLFGEDVRQRGLTKQRSGAGNVYAGVLVKPEWLPDDAVKLAALA
ncbi:MAG: phage/plasmid primase, P4 family [Rhodocyclaceae bacterium]|nr:phage/plasmid primase, P4 family [Rhodocyclaceae bacterium]